MQVLILEDALDIRADEFGLSKEVGSNNNGREMLKSVSRLRGENNSLRKSLKEATVNELHAKDQLQIMINENKKLSGLHKAKLSEVSTSKRSGAERSGASSHNCVLVLLARFARGLATKHYAASSTHHNELTSSIRVALSSPPPNYC